MSTPNGIVSVQGARIRTDLPGLFQVYESQSDADVLRILAPEITVNSRHSRMIKVRDASLVDERGQDNPVSPVGYNAPSRLGTQGFETFELVTNRYAFAKVIISDSDRSELASVQVDPEEAWMQTYTPQSWDVVGRIIGVELADTANYDATLQSTALAVNVATADLQGALRGAIRAFRALGVNPRPGELRAFINDTMADLMLGLNQVVPVNAIAGAPSAGATFAKLGTVDYSDLVTFFAKEGIELHVIYGRTVRSNGTVTPILANDLYLLFCEGGNGRSFLKRGNKADAFGGPGVPITFPSYDPVGIGMYMNGEWGLALPSTKLGFIFQGIDS
jgi:hypothetical protein